MAVNKLGIGKISFPFGIDNDLKIALEDFVARTSDNIDYLMKPSVVTVTSNFTASDINSVVLVDATSGAKTITVPTASSMNGKQLKFKKIDASANAVTISASGSEKIDGASTKSLATQNKYTAIVSDGSNWHIIANN